MVELSVTIEVDLTTFTAARALKFRSRENLVRNRVQRGSLCTSQKDCEPLAKYTLI